MPDTRAELLGALTKRFPEAALGDLGQAVDNLFRAMQKGQVIEKLSLSSVRPETDQQNILDAVKGLRRAEKALGKVGIHGGQAINAVASSLTDSDLPCGIQADLPYSKSGPKVAEYIGHLADSLEDSAKSVDLSAEHFWAADEDDYSSGRPKKVQADQVAKECGVLYRQFAGAAPTVSNRAVVDGHRTANEAYGPFLDMIDDVFKVLEISASSEVYAKSAVRDFSSKS